MLDSDVAMLYHYETKYINLAVKRNIERFPENFCFQLDEKELESLRLQFATLKVEKQSENLRSQIATLKVERENEALRSQIVTLNKTGRGRHRYVFIKQRK